MARQLKDMVDTGVGNAAVFIPATGTVVLRFNASEYLRNAMVEEVHHGPWVRTHHNRSYVATDSGQVAISYPDDGLYSDYLYDHVAGRKRYELSNHLGNVLAVVSDRSLPQGPVPGTPISYWPDVLTVNDYYPFGMTMEGRSYSSEAYKYGYQGSEADNEISKGSYDTYFRKLDTRIGRWWSIDPLASRFPFQTPFQMMSNNPINRIDPNGDSDFYTSEGDYLGNDGVDKDNVYVYNGTLDNFKAGAGLGVEDEITAEHLKGLDWFSENHTGSTSPNITDLNMTHGDFKNLAGTLYAEGTPWNLTFEEAAGIYSVLENRAKANKSTPLLIAEGGGIYGWSERDKINDPLAHKSSVKNAYKGLIMGITNDIDYSSGAYYWHGEDFGGPRSYSHAHESFYQLGFKFTDSEHDIWNLGNKRSGNKGWEYKYQSTKTEGQTTFMKLTEGWKTANGHKGW